MRAPPDDAAARREALRKEARRRRAALPRAAREAAALAVRDHLLTGSWLRRARRVGAYSACGTELDLGPTLTALHQGHKQVFLPRLGRGKGRMDFLQVAADTVLVANRHGIGEPPAGAPSSAPRFLQVVLIPLVAFDAAGTRLGSGVGYYDRCFGFRRHRAAWQAPLLVGVGFACQQVEMIPRSDWDVPLDLMVTEAGVVEPADRGRH